MDKQLDRIYGQSSQKGLNTSHDNLLGSHLKLLQLSMICNFIEDINIQTVHNSLLLHTWKFLSIQ